MPTDEGVTLQSLHPNNQLHSAIDLMDMSPNIWYVAYLICLNADITNVRMNAYGLKEAKNEFFDI